MIERKLMSWERWDKAAPSMERLMDRAAGWLVLAAVVAVVVWYAVGR